MHAVGSRRIEVIQRRLEELVKLIKNISRAIPKHLAPTSMAKDDTHETSCMLCPNSGSKKTCGNRRLSAPPDFLS